MEVVQFVPQLGKALWNLKVMYDQHVENGNEIKELQSFIQDYDHQIPILRERFQEGGGNVMGIAAFKNLEKDVMEATNKLERWSRNKSFFRVFNSAEWMQKLEKLHSKVMASVQKSLGIANLSMLLDVQATQATILESNAELKCLLITTIGSMHGTLPTMVRDEVVEASTSSFADPKFWEDILAAVDNHNARISSLEEKNMYEDPITTNLMIDPVVTSDGNTYCRWTIIDNNLTTNPFNMDEDLAIVVDNLNFRRSLFQKFPEQAQIFRQRRNQYRSHALSLKAQGLWGDAVLALHYVLQWDKRDVECVEALQQVQEALEEAKEKYLQPLVEVSNEMKNKTLVSRRVRNLELAQSQTPELLELIGLRKDKHKSSADLYSYSDSSDKMIDTLVNYKNNITESSSSPIDIVEPELVPEQSATSGQSGGGLEISTQEIHQTVDVPIAHKEHSIKDYQVDNSKGTLVLEQGRTMGRLRLSSLIARKLKNMSNEKKKEKDISAPTKFYGGKLKSNPYELKGLHLFSSFDIKRMTNDFNEENIICQGKNMEHHILIWVSNIIYYFGAGSNLIVYKDIEAGTGATVAVMRLRFDLERALEAFKTEIEMVSRLHHKYVVTLLGYCLKHDPILIYEYPDNGSLFDHLHGTSAKRSTLDWRMRLHIALNAAQGLEYLHTLRSPDIIHRNVTNSIAMLTSEFVTSRNILLTPEFDAKMTDFALVKFMSDTEDRSDTVAFVDYTGYRDLESATTASASTKSNVYSFGVVLLELITGRLPIDQSMSRGEHHIAFWVRKRLQVRERLKDNDIDSILAPIVKASNPNMKAVLKVAKIAMQSVESEAVNRPTMAQVIQGLKSALFSEVGSFQFISQD